MTNLIYNPSFEMEFSAQGAPEVVVAEGWAYGFNPAYGKRPEWQRERSDQGAGRVLEGASAQKWSTTHSRHRAWMSQLVVGLAPGTYYRLTAWVYVWSSDKDDPNQSKETGKVWVRTGINPWGDGNCQALSTQFGLCYVDKYDHWVRLETVAQAMKPEIAVFLFSQADFGVKHNDLYWDLVSLAPFFEPVEPPPEPPLEEMLRRVVREEVRSGLDQTRLTFANPGVIDVLRGPYTGLADTGLRG